MTSGQELGREAPLPENWTGFLKTLEVERRFVDLGFVPFDRFLPELNHCVVGIPFTGHLRDLWNQEAVSANLYMSPRDLEIVTLLDKGKDRLYAAVLTQEQTRDFWDVGSGVISVAQKLHSWKCRPCNNFRRENPFHFYAGSFWGKEENTCYHVVYSLPGLMWAWKKLEQRPPDPLFEIWEGEIEADSWFRLDDVRKVTFEPAEFREATPEYGDPLLKGRFTVKNEPLNLLNLSNDFERKALLMALNRLWAHREHVVSYRHQRGLEVGADYDAYDKPTDLVLERPRGLRPLFEEEGERTWRRFAYLQLLTQNRRVLELIQERISSDPKLEAVWLDMMDLFLRVWPTYADHYLTWDPHIDFPPPVRITARGEPLPIPPLKWTPELLVETGWIEIEENEGVLLPGIYDLPTSELTVEILEELYYDWARVLDLNIWFFLPGKTKTTFAFLGEPLSFLPLRIWFLGRPLERFYGSFYVDPKQEEVVEFVYKQLAPAYAELEKALLGPEPENDLQKVRETVPTTGLIDIEFIAETQIILAERLKGTSPHQRVLSLGTGTALEAMLFEGCDFFGMELSPQMAELARKRCEKLVEQGQLKSAEIIRDDFLKGVPFEGKFDIAIMSLVVHLLSPDERLGLFKAIKEKLREGGRLAISLRRPAYHWTDEWRGEWRDLLNYLEYSKVEVESREIYGGLGQKIPVGFVFAEV